MFTFLYLYYQLLNVDFSFIVIRQGTPLQANVGIVQQENIFYIFYILTSSFTSFIPNKCSYNHVIAITSYVRWLINHTIFGNFILELYSESYLFFAFFYLFDSWFSVPFLLTVLKICVVSLAFINLYYTVENPKCLYYI